MLGIYTIWNKSTNDIYIGSSINVKLRVLDHIKCLNENRHNNKKLQYAYNKYSKDSFVVILIQRVKYKENLITREQYWIDYYESYVDYNILSEADNLLGYIHDKKSRQKISNSKLGSKAWNKGIKGKYICTKKTRKKLSLSGIGRKSWCKGKKLLKETRRKMSMSHIGMSTSEKQNKN